MNRGSKSNQFSSLNVLVAIINCKPILPLFLIFLSLELVRLGEFLRIISDSRPESIAVTIGGIQEGSIGSRSRDKFDIFCLLLKILLMAVINISWPIDFEYH